MPYRHPSAIEAWLTATVEAWVTGSYYRAWVDGLGLAGAERVLEFGPGGGKMSRHLARALAGGGRLTCAEATPVWMRTIKRVLRDHDNIDYLAFPAGTFDPGDRTWDVAVIHFVLHDIEPEGRAPVVRAIARALVPGGRLVVAEPVKPGHGMPPEEVRSLATDAGLTERESGMAVMRARWKHKPMFQATYIKCAPAPEASAP